MDWYCFVFNSGEVSSASGAQFVYEKVCEGDFSLVGDIDIINNLYEDLLKEKLSITTDKGPGFIVIGANLSDAEFLDEFVPELCKKHGLSYYEPQNMKYNF